MKGLPVCGFAGLRVLEKKRTVFIKNPQTRKLANWQTAYIGIGSNLGNRKARIRKAIELVKLVKGVRFKRISSIYETEPVGGPPQGEFLNGVFEIETTLNPFKLLAELKPGAIFAIDKTGNIGDYFEGLEGIELSEDQHPGLMAYMKPSAESARSLASVLRNAVLLENGWLAYEIAFLLAKWAINKNMGSTSDETRDILHDIIVDIADKGEQLRANNNVRDHRIEEINQKTLEDVDKLIESLSGRKEEPGIVSRQDAGFTEAYLVIVMSVVFLFLLIC